MGITINGTTIPQNVANVLKVNGVNITQVIANSVSVWNQSLDKLTSGWSGSPITSTGAGWDTSGFNFRTITSNYPGSWIIVDPATGNWTPSGGHAFDMTISGNSCKYGGCAQWVYWNPNTKQFTGSACTARSIITASTSGGGIRHTATSSSAYCFLG